MAAGLCASNFATADSVTLTAENKSQSQSPADNSPNAKLKKNSAANPQSIATTETSVPEKPAGPFAHLERALIIVTIVNLLIIIGGLATYLVKRRMQLFIPVQMARMNQER